MACKPSFTVEKGRIPASISGFRDTLLVIEAQSFEAYDDLRLLETLQRYYHGPYLVIDLRDAPLHPVADYRFVLNYEAGGDYGGGQYNFVDRDGHKAYACRRGAGRRLIKSL